MLLSSAIVLRSNFLKQNSLGIGFSFNDLVFLCLLNTVLGVTVFFEVCIISTFLDDIGEVSMDLVAERNIDFCPIEDLRFNCFTFGNSFLMMGVCFEESISELLIELLNETGN